MDRPFDIWIDTLSGYRGFDLSDPKQARDFFDSLVIGPHGQTIGYFNRVDGTQFWVKDMNDDEVVGYAHMCARTILGATDQQLGKDYILKSQTVRGKFLSLQEERCVGKNVANNVDVLLHGKRLAGTLFCPYRVVGICVCRLSSFKKGFALASISFDSFLRGNVACVF